MKFLIHGHKLQAVFKVLCAESAPFNVTPAIQCNLNNVHNQQKTIFNNSYDYELFHYFTMKNDLLKMLCIKHEFKQILRSKHLRCSDVHTVNLKMPSLTLTFQISFSAPQNTQIFSRNLPNVGVIKLEKGTKKNINSKCLKKCMIQEHKRCPPPLSLPAGTPTDSIGKATLDASRENIPALHLPAAAM